MCQRSNLPFKAFVKQFISNHTIKLRAHTPDISIQSAGSLKLFHMQFRLYYTYLIKSSTLGTVSSGQFVPQCRQQNASTGLSSPHSLQRFICPTSLVSQRGHVLVSPSVFTCTQSIFQSQYGQFSCLIIIPLYLPKYLEPIAQIILQQFEYV